ncbi:MAG: DUF2848 domain-containing protein, partial [Candidatus Aenigmarchaeota archaeon]|nr:DUF2848 domain-containing protein [Candidatus Aenigmarchaeota archaeon]
LLIQSWTKPTDAYEWVLYQKALLGTIISPVDIIDLVKTRLKNGDTDGLVIFSGTVPVMTDEMIYSSAFRAELTDSRLGRTLIC